MVFLVQCINANSRGNGRDIVANITATDVTEQTLSDKEEEDLVVVKFMKHESMYNCEIEGQKGLENRFAIGIQVTSTKLEDCKEQESDLHLNDGPDLVGTVMHAAKKNLMVTLLQERVDLKDACLIQYELARGLKHMHDHGMLHADFKPLNTVRIDDSTWYLIDFDATVPIGKPVGGKISSAYCPPEMTNITKSEIIIEQPSIISSADIFSQSMLKVNEQTTLTKFISLHWYIRLGTEENHISWLMIDIMSIVKATTCYKETCHLISGAMV
eukprot:14417375-Ditylum_brightwellii.AAC.1